MEATWNLWLTIIACGVVTFLIRLSFIALHERVAMPDWFTRALTFVPVAVLSAITLPEIVIQNNALVASPFNARIIAALLAVLVAWRTKNVWATIGVGMAALWGIQILIK
ncbi:MAG: AzlD domain-containing protein [Chloroflexi bacterium]|nr:AzlD domain-containing protein [Chloroflexota bacterium]